MPAPALPAETLPAPQVTVTSDVASPQGRELTVDIRPPSGSYALTIDVGSGAGVQAIALNGTDVPEATAGTPGSVRVVAFSPRGASPLHVTVPADADVELVLGSYAAASTASQRGPSSRDRPVSPPPATRYRMASSSPLPSDCPDSARRARRTVVVCCSARLNVTSHPIL